jgi:thiol-disulfide isomerase/thioredoxin
MNLAKTAVLLTFSAMFSLAMAGEVKTYDQRTFDKLAQDGKPVVLAIYATWCPTCKAQRPIINELLSQTAYREVTTLMIDFDTSKPLLQKYRVPMQSTLIAFKGSKEVGRSVADTTREGIDSLIKKTLN